MELKEAILNRRTIRHYNDTPVTREEIRELINAAIHAPSACNLQQWRFVVIDDAVLLQKIQKAGAATFLKDVKQAILVTYSNQTDNVEYMDYVESAAAAIENMLLMATELKIGACWINNLPPKGRLRKILSIPKSIDPIALVSIGHFDTDSKEIKRKRLADEVISYNTFAFENVENKNRFQLTFRRLMRKIYKHLPFKEVLHRVAEKYEKRFDN